MNNSINVDFHVHSIASHDCLSKPEVLYERAKKLGLGKLVITDHNTISCALELWKRYPDYVIVGEEILTTGGEILAFFVKEELPKGLKPLDALNRLKEQDAFISLSHPYAMNRHGWTSAEMEGYLPFLDAIETCNARNPHRKNQLAERFAKEHGLCFTAGSDAHAVSELGAMGLELPEFNNAKELRSAIRSARVFGKESPAWVHLHSRIAVIRKTIMK